ncbi:ribosomal-protein-alanine N-acetyltransferase [Schumannella sp. 10F1B-5-1]|nr:ribosomal-protein-alanine N-acetyltransferase [Schumannella sp. 10F1B-5-1]
MRSELVSPHTLYLVAEVDGARPVAFDAAPRIPSPAVGPIGSEAVAPPPAAGDTADAAHIVGYAGLSAPSSADQGDVQNIAVVPELRGTGLGRQLLRLLIAEAERRGLADLLLEVRVDNTAAQRLYRSEGFAQIAIRPRYYRGAIDALIMSRPLANATAATAAIATESVAATPTETEGTP